MARALDRSGVAPYRSPALAFASREPARDSETFALGIRALLAALSIFRAAPDVVSADVTAGGLAALLVCILVAALPSP